MDNRELDNLYQEKLGDYKDQPDPRVWDRIRNSLDERKKSRLIPIWWRWGAAAAVLLGVLYLTAPWEGVQPELPAATDTAPARNPEREGEKPSVPEVIPAGAQEGNNALAGSGPEAGSDTPEGSQIAGEGVSDPDSTPSPSRPGTPANAGSPPGSLAILEKPSGEGPERPAEHASDARPLVAADLPEKGSDARSLKNSMAELADDRDELEVPETNGPTGKKSIFEAIEESEVAEVPEEGRERWSLGPSVAPVYFNSFGNGSPIASSFVNNSKSGTFNMSYGLQVSYRLSEKLRVRSGVHRVDYGYNTEDVGFTSSPSARPSSLIRTISYSEESKNLVVQSMVGGQQPMEPAAVDVTAPSPAREGQMLQEFGYLEIPLEMQYSLIDRKWGVDLIGGMSSLFLVNNSVSLESDGAVTEMGEATNLNSMNFSTNVGLGVFYRFTPGFEMSLQPMFKYQLSTFSETSGNFRPYSIGIYSGLNFRF